MKPSEDEQVAAALAATTYDEQTTLVAHSLGVAVALKVLKNSSNPSCDSLRSVGLWTQILRTNIAI